MLRLVKGLKHDNQAIGGNIEEFYKKDAGNRLLIYQDWLLLWAVLRSFTKRMQEADYLSTYHIGYCQLLNGVQEVTSR